MTIRQPFVKSAVQKSNRGKMPIMFPKTYPYSPLPLLSARGKVRLIYKRLYRWACLRPHGMVYCRTGMCYRFLYRDSCPSKWVPHGQHRLRGLTIFGLSYRLCFENFLRKNGLRCPETERAFRSVHRMGLFLSSCVSL